MSEPESTPLKASKTHAELARFFEGINAVAKSQAPDVAVADDLSLDEKEDFEVERQREELSQTRKINQAQLTILKALFWLIVLWLVSVMALTALSGLHAWDFTLSDKVMITYITSTTVSVLGLFHIAARWLFSKKKKWQFH